MILREPGTEMDSWVGLGLKKGFPGNDRFVTMDKM